MSTRISHKRKEQIKEIQSKLRSLDDSLEKMLQGEMKRYDFAKELGFTPNRLNHEIDSGVYSLLRNIKILTNLDIEELLTNNLSATERLVNELLHCNGLIIVSTVENDKMLEIMKLALNQLEYEVIKYRFGFADDGKSVDPLTLASIGDIYNISGSRVYRITLNALDKLRDPRWLRMMLPDYNLKIRELQETYEMINAKVKLNKELHEAKIILESNDPNSVYYDKSIHDLNLTTRANNCLRRGGIHTIGDLANSTYSDLKRIRNTGPVIIAEIIAALDKIGVKLKPED